MDLEQGIEILKELKESQLPENYKEALKVVIQKYNESIDNDLTWALGVCKHHNQWMKGANVPRVKAAVIIEAIETVLEYFGIDPDTKTGSI